MTSPLQEQLNVAMAEVHEYQGKLLAARQEAMDATVSVRSKDRLITVTVAGQGDVKEIKFHSTGYAGMPAAQLSAVLVETIAKAREELSAKVRGAFAPLSGAGTSIRESMLGGSELGELMGPLRDMLLPPVSSGKQGQDQDEEE